MKIREWFKIKEIRTQIKKIHWLEKDKLVKNSGIVIGFTFLMGLFFYASDGIIVIIFKMLGLN